MNNFFSTLLITWIFIFLAFLCLGIGYFLTGKICNRSSCGGINKKLGLSKDKNKKNQSCDICGK
jgi:hypothetical protein